LPKSYKLKLIIGGASGCGKTSFLNGSLLNDPPIGVSFKSVDCFANEGDSYRFLIWDLKAKERFRFLFPLFSRGACGAICCFDTSNYSSFSEIPRWISIFRKSAGKIPIILLGMKADLENREVSDVEIQEIIENFNLDGFFFTSIYDEDDDKKVEIFKIFIEKFDPDYPIDNFSIFHPNILNDEDFKEFLDFFGYCPICKRENHFDSIKSFYFSTNPNIIKIRESLLNLIEDSYDFEDIYYNQISFGIPCCTCHKKYF